MPETPFPHIRVAGAARERGRQYGQLAAPYITHNVEAYRRVFAHYAGWDWATVTQWAEAFVPPVEAYRPHLIEEIRGIAEGAELAFEDVLALNVRTEVMFAAVARAAAGGCTSFVALPAATTEGHTLVGQNWDWKPAVADGVIVLEAEPDQGPSFITVVEAGLLAKTGLNSAGLGLVTNALVSDADVGRPGVPYHIILRAILESERASQALDAITRHQRSSSANYLIAHRDGEAVNVEAAPGDYARVFVSFPEANLFSHTNHFFHPRFDLKDVGVWDGPGTLLRQRRAHRLLHARRGRLDVEAVREVLSDHFSYPSSVCSHPDPEFPEIERYATLFSVVMDLDTAEIWLSRGNPCQAPYRRLDTTLSPDGAGDPQ